MGDCDIDIQGGNCKQGLIVDWIPEFLQLGIESGQVCSKPAPDGMEGEARGSRMEHGRDNDLIAFPYLDISLLCSLLEEGPHRGRHLCADVRRNKPADTTASNQQVDVQ